jgi:3-oxoacyl-[acyl-carrier protein] reductase
VVSQSTPTSLITGGASGIGRATALRLAARGDQVVIFDLNERGLAEVAGSIRGAGGRAETYVVDVRDRAGVDRAVADVVDKLGGITYLFSNAGVPRRANVADQSLEDWQIVIDTHVTGTFHVCQSALPHMLERRSGAIVLTSSDFAIVGMPGNAVYAAAKTALYSLCKALALEFAGAGIRVNAIGPGPIDTPFLRSTRPPEEWEAYVPVLKARVPMRRLGRPEEVAAVVDFLLSDRAAYVTGQLVQPNGGQVTW